VTHRYGGIVWCGDERWRGHEGLSRGIADAAYDNDMCWPLERVRRFTISIELTGCCVTAYWIAFGPHGPRAQTPPGEGTKVFLYTMVGVGAAAVLFATTRLFARPPPSTLNKEWQEAQNEYMKVGTPKSCSLVMGKELGTTRRMRANINPFCRKTGSNQSLSSAERITRARVWSSHHLNRRSKDAFYLARRLWFVIFWKLKRPSQIHPNSQAPFNPECREDWRQG
jgi:hypothetical protein